MEKFLGNSGSYDIFGTLNGFRTLTELYVNKLVDEGKWFTLCHKIDSSQEDIMKVTNGDGVTLGSVIHNIFDNCSYRTAIYKYMLKNYLCYVEVPTVSFKNDTGGFSNTFNKMLVTSNVSVIAEWLDTVEENLNDKYKSRVYLIDLNDGDDELPYVKLTESKEGVRKASCPRKNLDVSAKGTRVIPLFMLKAGVDTLYDKMRSDMIKVSFLKDNGQVREMFTTADYQRIQDIYGKDNFYDEAVMHMYKGKFLENSNLPRGYIRVPEIGGSRYGGATRSINYARIISLECGVEPDLTYINIDLDTVLDGFHEAVQKYPSQAESIVDMLEVFEIDGGYWAEDKSKSKDMVSLLTWSEERKLLFSTVFLRELCMFMLSNPQWFSSFTGKPRYGGVSSGDVGLE